MKSQNLNIISVIFILFAASACGKLQNSSSSDANLYGSSVSGSTNFLQARAILANKCFSCHAEWSGYDEAQYVSTGRVSSGSPSNSSLYTRIRGNDTGTAGDMPLTGANLTTEEMTLIKTWISGT